MLKTLKWVYDLGVHQERQRIASYLRARSANLAVSTSSYRDAYNDAKAQKNFSKARLEKLQRAVELSEAVSEIISEILQPNWEQTMTSSIMFPDDKHKGEM